MVIFSMEGMFDQNGLEICCFSPYFEHPPILYDNFLEKMKSRCPERREKREMKSQGLAGHPVLETILRSDHFGMYKLWEEHPARVQAVLKSHRPSQKKDHSRGPSAVEEEDAKTNGR